MSEVITAAQIQSDLVLETEIIVEEARSILAGAQKNEAKQARLTALGFHGAGALKKNEQRLAEGRLMYEKQYAEKYPGLRFVHKQAMEKVCQKYGLLIGSVDQYVGEVPDWAIDVIERNKSLFRPTINGGTPASIGDIEWMYGSRGMWGNWRSQSLRNMSAGAFIDTRASQFSFQMPTPTAVEEKPKLMIAAPAKEMRVGAYQQVQGVHIVDVTDPIVALEVAGGYVVLAAWGEEGKDPQIINPINN